jgi:hypothetical protein
MEPSPFDGIFVPCTSSQSTCLTTSGLFFGSQGVCNTMTDMCECPEGYTGIDDVAVYNDCHINIKFRLACHGTTLVLSSLAAVVSLAALLKLAIMWGVVSWAYDDKENSAEKRTGGFPDKSEHKTRLSTSAAPVAPKSPRSGPLFAITLQKQISGSHSSSAHTSTPNINTANTNEHKQSPTKNSPSRPRSITRKVSGAAAPLQILESTPLHNSDRARSDSLSDDEKSAADGSPNRPTPKRKKSRTPRLSIKPMQQPKTNVRSASLVYDMSLAKRRRNTFLLMTGFALHSVSAVAVLACFVSYTYMAQRNAGLLFALAISLASFQWSLWVLAYSWCGSLQSMKGYARMFPNFASHPLMRFPWLASSITLICLVASSSICLAFFLGLPLSQDQTSLQQWVVPVGLTLLATLVLALTLFQSVVFSLLLRMFAAYTSGQFLSGEGGSPQQKTRMSPSMASEATMARQSAFVKARKTVLFVLILGCTSGPFVVAFLLIGAWTWEGRRHMYFFFSALFSLSAIIILGSTYVVVYRISSSTNQLGGQFSPGTKARKQLGSKLASSQQPQSPSELSPPSTLPQGPLVLAIRGGQSKESTDVQVS